MAGIRVVSGGLRWRWSRAACLRWRRCCRCADDGGDAARRNAERLFVTRRCVSSQFLCDASLEGFGRIACFMYGCVCRLWCRSDTLKPARRNFNLADLGRSGLLFSFFWAFVWPVPSFTAFAIKFYNRCHSM